MDKNAIKKFATWARRELIARVTKRAEQYGIAKEAIVPAGAASVFDHLLSAEEMDQRGKLIADIEKDGYERVMENVAYTWFNRFIALRYMEVNGFLPSHVRVFTDDAGAFNPQILSEALTMELDGLNADVVYAYKLANKTDELYKYLIITQCNALSTPLPRMFQRLADYTELLFPDNILREGSVVEQMIAMIHEDDWKEKIGGPAGLSGREATAADRSEHSATASSVQIIGWLYQYYNAEPKDMVFANLKKNIKISKNDIPAATQLFTPDWIVRYMVENSLGRLYIDSCPEVIAASTEEERASEEKRIADRFGWKYYLPEASQEPDVRKALAAKRHPLTAEQWFSLNVIDPCMGSGHILAYLFDVLVQIYEANSYTTREAVQAILEHNLYGLDIDDRAAQLAYFSVMMKARQYDRRFFSHITQPHVFAIEESNGINREQITLLGAGMPASERQAAHRQLTTLLDTLADAKEYGSILTVAALDWPLLRRFVNAGEENAQVSRESSGLDQMQTSLRHLIDVGEALAQRYDVVATNPPYMGSGNMDVKLAEFVKANYPDSKSDLFAVFIERCGEMTKQNGYQAMITQHVWMFLSSFEKLRVKLLKHDTVNMAHLGARAFEEIGGEVVQTTTFVRCNGHEQGYKGTYCRLIEPTTQQGKEDVFLAGKNQYFACQESFSKIPGTPLAYWVNCTIISAFEKGTCIYGVAKPRLGFATGDNDRFIRFWFEPSQENIGYGFRSRIEAKASGKKWFPTNKGGAYRKWYGNFDLVVNWQNDGYEIRNFRDGSGYLRSRPQNLDECFNDGVTWTVICNHSSFRYSPGGMLYNNKGPILGKRGDKINYLVLGYLNTCVSEYILQILSPTLGFEAGYISSLPYVSRPTLNEIVIVLVKKCISISCNDWDSFETSWDFQRHPLLESRGFEGAPEDRPKRPKCKIIYPYRMYKAICDKRFTQLKSNEESLNRIFIDIYGLQDELTPEVADKDVTVYRVIDEPNAEERAMRYVLSRRDVVVSLISYAVGCMFGRYSLDEFGLILAGQPFSEKFVYADVPLAGTGVTGEMPTCTVRGDCCLRLPDGGIKPCTFAPDYDNVLPICDDEYFEDDIVGRFVQFIEAAYGSETLDENLRFIADALGGTGQPKDVIRAYFLNNFYADHLKTYQKRPIYWLFDSGKKNGFKALIYMHRYQPDTIARVRTDYVHEQQSRYRTAIADLENRAASASPSERVKLTKRITAVRAQADELRAYEEKIHHLADQMIKIDLDDGVKVNYETFSDVLAKIK